MYSHRKIPFYSILGSLNHKADDLDIHRSKDLFDDDHRHFWNNRLFNWYDTSEICSVIRVHPAPIIIWMTLNGTSSWNLRCSNWLKTTRRKVCNKNINSFGLVKRIKSAATIFSSEVFIYTERRVSFSICLVSQTLLINRGQLLRKWLITKTCIFVITFMTY